MLLTICWVVYGAGLLNFGSSVVFNVEDLRRLQQFMRRRTVVDLT
jgi:hypothetical protein